MKKRPIAVAVLLSCMLCTASAAPAAPPKLLTAQVERLVALMRDSYATGYPEATLVQMVSPSKGRNLALTVFTIESFGGGNNHQQFFAVFEHEVDKAEKREYYRLIDVMPIGGKGWRAVMELNAKTQKGKNSSEVQILIPALEVGPDDGPNFPSRKTTIKLVLGERLTEVKAR